MLIVPTHLGLNIAKSLRMKSVLENHNMLLTVGLRVSQSGLRIGELPVRLLDLERNIFTCLMLGRISQRWPESSLTLRATVHWHLDPTEHHLHVIIIIIVFKYKVIVISSLMSLVFILNLL